MSIEVSTIDIHKTCNPQVWIVEQRDHYEASNVIGVYDSKEKAESACLKHITTLRNPDKFTKGLDQDDEVEWTYRHESVSMVRHDVQ